MADNSARGPSAEDASEIVRSLLEPAPSEVFSFVRIGRDGVRKEIPVRVQLLSVEENHAALIAAQLYAKERGEVSKDYGDVYKEAQAVELLARALRRVKVEERRDGTEWYPALFVNAQQLRQSFTEPEMAQCLNMYELVKAKFGAIEAFDVEAIDTWIARLAEPLKGAYFLGHLDSSHWPMLILQLARRARDLSDLLGLTPSDSPDSSESDQESSEEATTSFSGLPSAHSASGDALPEDRVLTRDEARAIVAERRKGDGDKPAE